MYQPLVDNVPGLPWQGLQYNQRLSDTVPNGLAVNYWSATYEANMRPGIPGWGDQAFYGDCFTPQLAVRAGYAAQPFFADLEGG